MAETIMKKLTAESSGDWFIDSAGLEAYHEGEPADRRMMTHAARRGYKITHISRPMTPTDWDKFDIIVCMDVQNHRTLQRRAPSPEHFSKVVMATDFCQKFEYADCVPDPYYGGAEGFEYVIDLLEDVCQGLIARL